MLDTSQLMKTLDETIPDPDESTPDDNIVTRFRTDESLDIGIYITDLELWGNYINDDLYYMDKKVREMFKRQRRKREQKGGWRTTAPQVFLWIYGRPATPSDGATCRVIHELLRYYCSSFTGTTTYKGKRVDRVYNFTPYATRGRRPYSLRLRLEEADNAKNVWRESSIPLSSKRNKGRFKYRKGSMSKNEGRSDAQRAKGSKGRPAKNERRDSK